MKMKPKIDFKECLKDSPKFRTYLEQEEVVIDHLESKLEKVIKMCQLSVDSGKAYIENQSAFATSLWDLQMHFQDNSQAQNALKKIVQCLQEMNKFHTTLLDQASRTVIKNLTSFQKSDIKEVKEYKSIFLKVSDNYDGALSKNAQANKNRLQEVTEAVNVLSASKSCFRHTALDYVNLLTMMQAKKMPEILATLLSYYQAFNAYFHQGYEHCADFDVFFKSLADDIDEMRQDAGQLEKHMQNRHLSVNQYVEMDTNSINQTNCTQIEGYLFKRTSKGFKTWNRRWFYILNNQLVYRKRAGEDFPTVMEEELKICTVRPFNDSDRRFCFEIISPTKSHILQADSQESQQYWMVALQKCIGSAIQYNTGTDPSSSNNCDSKYFPNSNLSKKVRWDQLLKVPGNSICCDCGHPEPRWASINLGITLCIACSGVHRSLGVHYSKVRSLTLDAWEPEIAKVMMELGNAIVNRIYEAHVANDLQRATLNCDQAVRESWIKAKYIEKRFVNKLAISVPDSVASVNHNGATDSDNLSKRTNPMRWSVKKWRRKRPEKENTSSNASSSGVSMSTDLDVAIIGENLEDPLHERISWDEWNSDQDSTSGDEDILENENFDNLNPNMVLYKASRAHNLPVMCQAFALGADKNWTNETDLKRTCLHQAVLSGSVMSVEYLLLNGAQINVLDINGFTPLHLATEKGCTAQAYLLLKNKAQHDLVNVDGKKPIDIAVEQANADIVTLIRLTKLNEEIGYDEQTTGEGDTYNDVMKDFSHLACSQPNRLQRSNQLKCDPKDQDVETNSVND